MNDTQIVFFSPDTPSIEELRRILEAQRGAPVSTGDAKDVGIGLISLYECLARKRPTEETGQ